VTGKKQDQVEYANGVNRLLAEAKIVPVGIVSGEPYDVRDALNQLVEDQKTIDVLIVTKQSARWKFLKKIDDTYPELAGTKMVKPEKYWYPDFLKQSNLMAIADRIVVIALIAIGMTMVIITTGIDLSVGSLIALSAVIWTLLIRDYAGAENAGAFGMLIAALVAILLCVLSGVFFRVHGDQIYDSAIYRHAGDDDGGERAGIHFRQGAVDLPGPAFPDLAWARGNVFRHPEYSGVDDHLLWRRPHHHDPDDFRALYLCGRRQ
jgi:hypothetical protein